MRHQGQNVACGRIMQLIATGICWIQGRTKIPVHIVTTPTVPQGADVKGAAPSAASEGRVRAY